MKHISLLPVMDRDAVALLLPELREAVQANAAVTIMADRVDQIGQAGLQLILSVMRSATAAGLELIVRDPSPAFVTAAELAGLSAQMPGAAE